MGNEFYRRNEDGLVELVDGDTGQVLCVQASVKNLFKNKEENLTKYERPDGTVIYLEKHLSFDSVTANKRMTVPFSEVIADEICQAIIEGRTITSIAKDDRYPDFYTIQKWRKSNPIFDSAIKEAFSARADFMHDKLLETAESITDKDDAVVKKARMDAYKWSAEKTNSEQYGQKTKISGDVNAPLQLIIDTGVPAPEALPPKDVSPKLEVVDSSSDDKYLQEETVASGNAEATDKNT